MSVRIDIQGLPELQAMLRDLTETQIPKAIAVALNRTAWDVMVDQREAVVDAFGGGITTFIKRGIRYEKATATKQYSRSYWESNREKIISPHVFGGARSPKKIENVLRARGVLPGGLWLTPGPFCKKDQYGNPTRAMWGKLYDAITSLATTGKYGDWFIGGRYPRAHLFPGIWERRKGTIQPVFFFVREPQYRKRYDFYGIAEQKAREVLAGHLSDSVRKALELARR